MNREDETGVDRLVARLKRRPLIAILIVIGSSLVALSQFTDATRKLVSLAENLFSHPAYRLVSDIPDASLMLRWNGLVYGWRHPARDLTFETELRLPLGLKNSGNVSAHIEQFRLLSECGAQQIVWEAVWKAREFTWERLAPIEPQIQQQRDRLKPFSIEPDKPSQHETIDFVPVDYPEALGQGSYRNLLQARVSGTEGWVDLMTFSFTIPADFKLGDERISRYQYWQQFPAEILEQKDD